MKKTYRKFISFMEHNIAKINTFKTYIFEWISIFKKRKLYKNIKWSRAQKKQFRDYWKNNYGRRISPRWHKLYESINNTHQPDYLPDIIFSTKIEPYFNPYYYSKILSDKSIQEVLYSSHIMMPKTYLINCNGVFTDQNKNIISTETALNIMENIGDVIVKPTVGTSSGDGVNIYKFNNGIDTISNKSIKEIMDSYKINYIIQEKMIQHQLLSSINSSSVNTIRVITYLHNGKIYSTKAALRIGNGKSHLDNIHSGGIVVGINDDGRLKEIGYQLGWLDSKKSFYAHPESGIIFKDFKIPNFMNTIDSISFLHGLTPQVKMISWDLMICENGLPAVLEANLLGQSAWFIQIVHCSSLFGINTNMILNEVKNQ